MLMLVFVPTVDVDVDVDADVDVDMVVVVVIIVVVFASDSVAAVVVAAVVAVVVAAVVAGAMAWSSNRCRVSIALATERNASRGWNLLRQTARGREGREVRNWAGGGSCSRPILKF